MAYFPAETTTGLRGRAASPPLVIGLVNSMPGEALGQTERQFHTILTATSRHAAVQIRLFTLDPASLANADEATRARYQDATAIESAGLDGLIVTGMPPRAAALTDEPYWKELTALVDLAAERGIPTVWSCLAAHAAVLYLDGIERRRLPEKLSGVYACVRTDAAHPLTAKMPPRWRIPHSRYNELPIDALTARGYGILSVSAEAGADLFVKDVGAHFLFCQGHPEYDAHALLREYRRDIRQFLNGASDTYPEMPRGCFGPEVTAQLAAFREHAIATRTPQTLAQFPNAACEADLRHSWRDLAHGLYANWLDGIAARKPHSSPIITADDQRPEAALVREGWTAPSLSA